MSIKIHVKWELKWSTGHSENDLFLFSVKPYLFRWSSGSMLCWTKPAETRFWVMCAEHWLPRDWFPWQGGSFQTLPKTYLKQFPRFRKMQCLFEVSASGISIINLATPKLKHRSLCQILSLNSYKRCFFFPPKFLIVLLAVVCLFLSVYQLNLTGLILSI